MRPLLKHIIPGQRGIVTGLLVMSLFAFAGNAKGQSPATSNEVKAVFLYNFCRFVTWPLQSMSGSNNSFVIGILGNDPFGNFLQSMVEGEKVDGLPIVIRRYTDAEEIRTCHILYINKRNASDIAKNLRNRSILTVGDAEDFAVDGGMIRFSFVNNKIRLQINAKTAKLANLTISSKLLRVADVIDN